MKNLIIIISLIIIFSACQANRNQNLDTKNIISGDTVNLIYAEGFEIIRHKNYKEVIVNDPWTSSQMLAKYYLVSHDSVYVPGDGQRFVLPVKTIAATSATHFEFLSLLGVLDLVNGVCSPELIYNEHIREDINDGLIENIGDAFNINLEKTLRLNPDIVMMSGFKQDDPYAKRVMQAGINVVYNNEWMESSLLARAEWIKFVATFFDKEKEADSIFNEVNNKYLEIREMAKSAKTKPSILTGSNFRGTWYVPGGDSFMAHLFYDAGGNYFYSDDKSKGSLPLNIETVLNNFAQADVWLNCNFSSINELVNADKKHSLFKPVKSKRVYNFNKRMLKSGANDYWESAIARPDLLLRDVISVLHPELIPDYETVYINQLN
ncbi:ABC transporter substrate-binding protein [Paludibacter sp.]